MSTNESKSVLVTGACGRFGKLVVRVLHRDRSVIAVDRRAFPDKPADVIHVPVDLRRTKLRDVFRQHPIEAVIHLGVMHDPRASAADHHAWNVSGFAKLLDYVAQFSVKKLVVLSSANVYGPQPDNPQFLSEDSPLLAGARFSEIRDLVEVDMLAQRFFWKHPDTETVVLRPVHILGNVRNAASNFLRLPQVPTLLGFDPMIQVISERDVVRAVESALESGRKGVFNIAGPEPVPLSRIIKILRKPHIPVPYTLAKLALRGLWNLRFSDFPAPELDHIRYVCMVDAKRSKAQLGFQHQDDLRATIRGIHVE